MTSGLGEAGCPRAPIQHAAQTQPQTITWQENIEIERRKEQIYEP